MLSIIIPTYNEAACIRTTIQRLWAHDEDNLIGQILVCDSGSTDGTVETAKAEGVEVVFCPKKGRSAQMNFGAGRATGDVLYFLHADTVPPKGFTQEICNAVQHGFAAGCYRLAFDYAHWFLKANCWFTRFDVDAIRFGDQSLFVTKKAFAEAGGFCEKHVVLEDQHLVKKLKRQVRFTVFKRPVVSSARKYRENGVYKTQGVFFLIYFLYHFGLSQQRLVNIYRKMIRQDKL